MRTIRFLALLAVVPIGAGCGDDDGTGPSPAQLTGTWSATKFEFASTSDPSTRLDAISLGATLTMVLESDGSLSLTVIIPEESSDTATGSWTAEGDVLTISLETGLSGDWQFDMSLSGDTLTLSGAHVEWDFNDDGVDDPALLNLVLVRS